MLAIEMIKKFLIEFLFTKSKRLNVPIKVINGSANAILLPDININEEINNKVLCQFLFPLKKKSSMIILERNIVIA